MHEQTYIWLQKFMQQQQQQSRMHQSNTISEVNTSYQGIKEVVTNHQILHPRIKHPNTLGDVRAPSPDISTTNAGLSQKREVEEQYKSSQKQQQSTALSITNGHGLQLQVYTLCRGCTSIPARLEPERGSAVQTPPNNRSPSRWLAVSCFLEFGTVLNCKARRHQLKTSKL